MGEEEKEKRIKRGWKEGIGQVKKEVMKDKNNRERRQGDQIVAPATGTATTTTTFPKIILVCSLFVWTLTVLVNN